jgi:hypothetical protein
MAPVGVACSTVNVPDRGVDSRAAMPTIWTGEACEWLGDEGMGTFSRFRPIGQGGPLPQSGSTVLDPWYFAGLPSD